MCRRKPCVKWKHARLCPKTDQHNEHCCQQNLLVSLSQYSIQRTARCECERITIAIQEEYSKKAEICTAHGIKQIFQCCHDRFPRSIVKYKRNRCQCHQFVEEIHRHKISRENKRYKNTKYYQIRSKISFFFSLMFHINKRVDSGCYPHHTDDRDEQSAHIINAKTDRNILHQMKHNQAAISRPRKACRQNSRQNQHGPGQNMNALQIPFGWCKSRSFSIAVPFCCPNIFQKCRTQEPASCNDRQKNRK